MAMTEYDLITEFRRIHFRLKDGMLGISSYDKLAIDRQRKFLKDLTNAEPPIIMYNDQYQCHYDFNLITFHQVTNLMKKHNQGSIKHQEITVEDIVINKKEFHMGRDSVEDRNVARIFVKPEENEIKVLTKPKLKAYVFKGLNQEEFNLRIKEIRNNTDRFMAFLDPILDEYKKNKVVEVKEKMRVSKDLLYKVTYFELDKKLEERFTSYHSMDKIEDICKKLYGPEAKVEKIEVQSLEEMIKTYNIKVQQKIKELQELRIC